MNEPIAVTRVPFNCRQLGTFVCKASPIVEDNGRQRRATKQEAFCGSCTFRYRVSPCPYRPAAHSSAEWGGQLQREPKRSYRKAYTERDCEEHAARLWLETVRPPRHNDFKGKLPSVSVMRRRLGNMEYIRAAALRLIGEWGRLDEIKQEDQWECLICGEVCRTSAGLNSHMRRHKRKKEVE